MIYLTFFRVRAYNLHDLRHVSWVESVLQCTDPAHLTTAGQDLDDPDRDLSDA